MVRTLSAKPRIDERERIVLIVFRIALHRHLQCLSVALGNETCALVTIATKQVLHREVGELQTCTAYNACDTPTCRHFDLVTSFGHQWIGDVYCSRTFIGAYVFEDFALEHFVVKLLCCSQFAHGALQSFDGKEVARLGANFTTNDVVVNTVVAGDAHTVELGLFAFANAHFKVDAVAFYFGFYGF